MYIYIVIYVACNRISSHTYVCTLVCVHVRITRVTCYSHLKYTGYLVILTAISLTPTEDFQILKHNILIIFKLSFCAVRYS